jgi:hypothetical protein
MRKSRGIGALLLVGMGAGIGCSTDDGPTTPPTQPPQVASTFARVVKGGRFHQTNVPSFTGARGASPAQLVPAVADELRREVGELRASDFVQIDARDVATPSGRPLTHVSMRQTVGGVPIHGTWLNLTLREDGARSKVVASSYHLYDRPAVATVPAITRDRAIVLARDRMRVDRGARLRDAALVIRPIDGRLQLVWDVTVEGAITRGLVIAEGPRAGRVVTIDDRVYQTAGNVEGFYAAGGAPGAMGVVTQDGLPGISVNAGGTIVQTDIDGNFGVDVPLGTPIDATLTGRASQVNNLAGPVLADSEPAAASVLLGLGTAASPEQELSQVTAYFYTDATRTFLEENGVPGDALGAAIPTNVNLPDICNAYYTPGSPSINFFASGGGCNNSAIDSVIAHEYGHFVDDMFGGIMDGGLSEGWGDLLSCLSLRQPLVGEDFTPDGSIIRTCDNTYQYPPGGMDEVHNLGQAWAGFGWHARAGLIAALGEADGDLLARQLILPSFPSNAADIPAAVREVFLRDDDDGDITNQTPHWDILYAAAEMHSLQFAVEGDLVAPGPVADLTVGSVGATSVELVWTAPGDDGIEGMVAGYDIRWSLSPIVDENDFFAAAQAVGPAAPVPAGAIQTHTIQVPPASTVHAALRAVDEAGNFGPISNSVTFTTEEGITIFYDGAEGGLGEWTATGLWHVTSRRAAAGAQSFWYGDEATGTFDTGTANSGDLVSPIIDLGSASGVVLAFMQFIDVEDLPQYDLADVYVADVDDPNNFAYFPKQYGSSGGQFLSRVESLQQFDGRRIQLIFHFDTVDEIANLLEGWYLDEIRVLADEASTCEHPKCEEGGPLTPDCDDCVAQICAIDPFCCETAWDALCVSEVESICGETCAGPTCDHAPCEPGAPLDPSCDPCVEAVCATDPYCCTNEWDRQCVDEAEAICGLTCNTCAHDLCEPGAPLEPTCDSCVTEVCAADPYCCDTSWDRYCVEGAEELCGLECEGCAHEVCELGDPLDPATCDACVQSVCDWDPFCCSTAWDERCVLEAEWACGISCEGCAHDLCEEGLYLDPTCDPCVETVCAIDAWCCSVAWDDRCVEEAAAQCGLPCEIDLAGDGHDDTRGR